MTKAILCQAKTCNPDGLQMLMPRAAVRFVNHFIKNGFKIPDQVQGQGADRSGKRSIRAVCEHLPEVCNAAIEPQMGF
jgi:hypothetical protein